MISITDDETGQLLQFPDDTPEDVIRATIGRVRAGTHAEHTIDLSSLRPSTGPDFSDVNVGGAESSAPISSQPVLDLSGAGSRAARRNQRIDSAPDFSDVTSSSVVSSAPLSPQPDRPLFTPDQERYLDVATGRRGPYGIAPRPAPDMVPADTRQQMASFQIKSPTPTGPPPMGRSEDFWRSVTGSDNPEDWSKYARSAQLAETEQGGSGVMSQAGFQDRGMYYENSDTGERYLKHHKSGMMPGPDAIDYNQRPGTIPAIKDVMSPEEADAAREFVSGLPARVAGSVAGMVGMAGRAIEGTGAGLRAEIEDLSNAGYGAYPSSGAGFRRGFLREWQDNPIGRGADIVQRDIADPARERLLDASIRAGDSPLGAAGTETGQAATAEVLNPLNWIGPGEVIRGLRGAEALSPAAVRAAELEAQGGARALENAGLIMREYGTGSAASEAAQRQLTRAPLEEPLLRFDRNANGGLFPGAFKGRLPDAIADFTGRPWRLYGNPDSPIPIERPTSPVPRPRSVDRPPLPLPKIEGALDASDDELRQLAGYWNYASRRYPLLTSRIETLKLNHGAQTNTGYWQEANKTLAIAPGSDFDTFMHEVAHVAQAARGQYEPFGTVHQNDAGLAQQLEPYAIRTGETYGRIPRPLPADLSDDELDRILYPDRKPSSGTVSNQLALKVFRGDQSPADGLSGDLTPLTKGEYFRAFNDESIQPTGGIRSDGEARAYTAWLEKNGLNPDHVERFGESPELEQKFFDLHNPDLEPEQPVPQSELARIGNIRREPPANSTAPVVSFKPSLDRHAPIVGVERAPNSDDFVLSFDTDSGQRLTAENVRSLFPDLPEGYGIELEGANNPLRPNLQRVRVHFWNKTDPRVGAARHITDDFVQRLGGLQDPPSVSMERSLSALAEHVRQDQGLPAPAPIEQPSVPRPETSSPIPASTAEAKVLPFDPGAPRRLYASGPPPAPAPLTEQQVARAMGWDVPPGPPRAISDPIRTAQFQTNLAAQLGGGPESDHVAQFIVDNSDDVFRKIGPPQSWDTVEEMAARSGTTAEQFLRDNPRWNTLPPEERLRLTYVIKGNDQAIGDLQAKVVAGTATPEDQAELLRRIDTASDLIKIGAKAGSDYGRALNTLKIEARLALGDDQLLKQRLYRMYADQLDKQKPLMDSLARLNPGDQNELQAFLRQVNKPSKREFLHEYWVNSILSTPIPFERKVIGDTIMMLGENGFVRPLSAVWDAARTMGPGAAANAEREVFLREAPAAFVGLGRGLRQGFARGLEVLKRGYDPRLVEGSPLFIPRSAFARAQSPFVRNVVGPIVTMPTRVISAATTMARTMNFTAELYAQAARIASKEELAALKGGANAFDVSGRIATLVQNPTDEMLQAADQFAGRATFTDPTSAIGRGITWLRDLPGIKSSNPVGNAALETYRAGSGFLLPFVHIADRLMVRGFEYTPFNFANTVGQRMAGNYAEAASQAARASIGSLVMAYAASMALEDRITGAAPKDEGERAAFYGANKQPWSIRTDSGTWVPYGHMQPIAMPLALVAAFHQGWKENPDDDLMGKITDGAVQVGTHITDQSYLLALSKLMEVLHGGTPGSAGRAGSDLAASTVWGLAPYSGLTRTIAKAIDPRVVDAKSFSDRLTQNMPVASLGLNGKLDPWGEEVIPAGGRARTFLASGTALLPTQEQSNPLDEELGRLGMPLGYVGNNITDHKQKIKLSDDEHFLYQQMAGRASRLLLQELFAKEGYGDLDTEDQRSEATKAIGAARKFARIVVLRYHNGSENYPGLNPSLGVINWVNSTGTGAGH